MAILSVQSHVVRGAVGNRAASFAIERMGVEAWTLPTVLFSNHPAHGDFRGRAVAADVVDDLLASLDGHWGRCAGILSGYLADAATAEAVARAVARGRSRNPDIVYACNAAFAHESGAFVAPAVVRAVTGVLLPAADLLFLNQSELSLWAASPHAGVRSVLACCRAHWPGRARLMVVTSVRSEEQPNAISTLAVTPDRAWVTTTPVVGGPAHGAGDLFSAIFFVRYLRGEPVADALAQSVAAALRTITLSGSALDLDLVAAQDEFLTPTAAVRAVAVTPD
ncbi:MAG: pyridoxal kinase [Alphaproteobacteria bacterium]|nr:pyridoxal kinase [Alphaproteobacteria bacterium]